MLLNVEVGRKGGSFWGEVQGLVIIVEEGGGGQLMSLRSRSKRGLVAIGSQAGGGELLLLD